MRHRLTIKRYRCRESQQIDWWRPLARTHVKAAQRPDHSTSVEIRQQVSDLLGRIESGGEQVVQAMAVEYDGWDGPIVVDRPTIEAATRSLPTTVVDDIRSAHGHIQAFARAQRDSLHEVEVELAPGLIAGQRLAHVASALMSVTTSSVAEVDTVVVASPARPDRGGVHPAILFAADLAGADVILGLGGVQAIGALAFGLYSDRPADVIVGPGNALVAEAKRQLFGQVGIDVIAGPTESMIVADDTADAHTVATDLVSQAEHGADSPVWLVTTAPGLAEQVNRLVPDLANALPEPARASATTAWRSHGEIIVVDNRDEAAEVCDEYAPEHLQVMARDLDWWKQQLRNYGSLFLGEETTVTFGDKSAGPNHTLPTGRAARYTGGLNVLKFLKQLTWHQMTPEAAAAQAPVAARISRLEGMEGHARAADLRMNPT